MSAVAESVKAATVGVVRISALGIRTFRNLERVDLIVPPEGFALIGENGQGKTNLLEAIAYFAVMRSLRGARDQDLVRFTRGGEPQGMGFHMTLRCEGAAALEVSVGFDSPSRRKKVMIDGVVVARLSDAFGAVPSVVVAPRDVALIAGSPGERRRFLDVLLAMADRRYLAALQHYRAALVRRNAALRRAARRGPKDAHSEIAVWDPALAQSGASIRRYRMAWLAANAARVAALCAGIGEREAVELRYAARGETHAREDQLPDERILAADLGAALARDRERDLRRALTHAGPHRDSLAISLGGHPARLVASAGQQRTIAIALRLAAHATLRDALGRVPVLLLDDPLAELDARRAAQILELLIESGEPGGQLIIAVPRSDNLPATLGRLARLTIRGGVVTP
ncbi:MAG: DNA replication/repair protein RecF [Gemmatimonadaceae bacterium]